MTDITVKKFSKTVTKKKKVKLKKPNNPTIIVQRKMNILKRKQMNKISLSIFKFHLNKFYKCLNHQQITKKTDNLKKPFHNHPRIIIQRKI